MPANSSVDAALSLIKADSSKLLGLTVGKYSIAEPGQFVPKADAQSAPELSFTSVSPTGTYLVVGLDIDAPFPSWNKLGPILHWIQPGLKPVPRADGSYTLQSDKPFVANYIGPAPPPPSSPHRYMFFLYEQPAGFDGSKYAPPNGQTLGNVRRMWYSLDEWEKQASLGPILAANYFKSN
ncbi:putative protease inhibitor [Thozetella sp. PMI_491]|nr:putative protease inhibitor [Thozetella sp. PMI_491]